MACATQSFQELFLASFLLVLFCFRLCACCRIFRTPKLAAVYPRCVLGLCTMAFLLSENLKTGFLVPQSSILLFLPLPTLCCLTCLCVKSILFLQAKRACGGNASKLGTHVSPLQL